jgi:hypothetical protein
VNVTVPLSTAAVVTGVPDGAAGGFTYAAAR